jgi:hypothetical protein
MKYEVEICSGAKFNKDLFRYSKVNSGDSQTHRHTDNMEIS